MTNPSCAPTEKPQTAVRGSRASRRRAFALRRRSSIARVDAGVGWKSGSCDIPTNAEAAFSTFMRSTFRTTSYWEASSQETPYIERTQLRRSSSTSAR